MWDFVVVDGPGDFLVDGALVRPPNGDVFKLVDKLNPGAIVYVDGGVETAHLIGRFLGKFLNIVNQGQGFTVFQRNDNKYQPKLVVDQLKEQLTKINYFNGNK